MTGAVLSVSFSSSFFRDRLAGKGGRRGPAFLEAFSFSLFLLARPNTQPVALPFFSSPREGEKTITPPLSPPFSQAGKRMGDAVIASGSLLFFLKVEG